MPALTEHELIKGCTAQDRKVQACLYKQYYSQFLKICLRYANSQQDAEQWMNDGFYKIFTRIAQYKNEGSFEGWMKRVMIYTCLDNIKSAMNKQGSRYLEIDEVKAQQLEQTTTHDTIQHISFKELIRLIQTLPAMHKTVFNLYVFDGYSHKEIAQQLSIKEGTSYWYVNKAREILKQLMSAQVLKPVRHDK